MENFSKFTTEEDTFLQDNFGILKISRLAIRLDRPYFMVESRLVALQFLDEKKSNGKYYTDDEIDYNLLKSGCTEEELKRLRGSMRVGAAAKFQGNISEIN